MLRSTLITVLALCASPAMAYVSAEDMHAIENAECSELVREYHNYSAGEKKLAEEIKQSSNSTVATNVIGVATMATLGIGFFTWNDNSDAKTNLAELQAYRDAIGAAAKKKGCSL